MLNRVLREGRAAGAAGLLFSFLLICGLQGFAPAVLEAQEGPTGYRKWLYATVGALALGIPAALSEDIPLELGGCNESSCFAPLAAATGGVVGFLIGYERDQAAARNWVFGPQAELAANWSLDLPIQPERVLRYGSGTGAGALVIGDRGMIRVDSQGSEPYLGVRGIQDAVVFRDRRVIVAATTADLYAFSLGEPDLQGRRIAGSGASALSTDGDAVLFAAGAGTLRRHVVEGSGAEMTVVEGRSAVVGGATRTMSWATGQLLWSAVGSRLEGRDPGTLDEIASVSLPSPVFRIAVGSGLVVGAAGRNGVLILDVSDPGEGRVVGRYEGVQYVHDVALHGRRAYLAAGNQGLVILDLTNPSEPLVEAVVRNLGSVHAVVRMEDGVYLLDREERLLQRVPATD